MEIVQLICHLGYILFLSCKFSGFSGIKWPWNPLNMQERYTILPKLQIIWYISIAKKKQKLIQLKIPQRNIVAAYIKLKTSPRQPRLGWVGIENTWSQLNPNFMSSRASTNHLYRFSWHIKLFIPKITKSIIYKMFHYKLR